MMRPHSAIGIASLALDTQITATPVVKTRHTSPVIVIRLNQQRQSVFQGSRTMTSRRSIVFSRGEPGDARLRRGRIDVVI